MAGYLRFNKLKIYQPSFFVEYEANLVYQKSLNEAQSKKLITEYDIKYLLYKNGDWNNKKEKRYTELPKIIEDTKVKLYESRTRADNILECKEELNRLRSEFADLFNTLHSYDAYTAEGISNFARLSYIIRNTTFLNKKLYNFNRISLDKVIDFYQRNILNEEHYRELGRTEPWTLIWNSIKSGSFKIKQTPEQRKLIRVSSFYDSLKSSPDCPPDVVLEDDDMLDGYLILQRRNHEKENNSNDIMSKLGKSAGCSEIYVVCSDNDKSAIFQEKDIEKVYGMNDRYAKTVLQAREKVLSEKGIVREEEMPDVKKELQLELARMSMS